MTKLLDLFPVPFLDDLVSNRCIPFIGAGFSKNAYVPDGDQMPNWEELGRRFSEKLQGYQYSTPLDAISAYDYEYSRAKVVEELHKFLLVESARPGEAHKSFAELPFETVITTNFEFLLERSYQLSNRYCLPIIGEDQLAINASSLGTKLLKFHGDIHHPRRLVITEDDYDLFLDRYPLIATHLANLLIGNTMLLIGYSLDDPDLRQIWQVAKSRLGNVRRPAYSLQVAATNHIVARYERRGVRVINLPRSRSMSYGQILAQAFDEINEFWSSRLIELSTTTTAEDDPQAEFKLPSDAMSRLCLFIVPMRLAAFYKSEFYPLAESFGFVPVMAIDVMTPGDSFLAKISALIDRAGLIFADVSSQFAAMELGMAITKEKKTDRIMIVIGEASPVPEGLKGYKIIRRSEKTSAELEYLRSETEQWFVSMAEKLRSAFYEEPRRLLDKKEYKAAVISAVTVLENELRRALEMNSNLSTRTRVQSLRSLIEKAIERELINSEEYKLLLKHTDLRNQLVHTQVAVNVRVAKRAVMELMEISNKIRAQTV